MELRSGRVPAGNDPPAPLGPMPAPLGPMPAPLGPMPAPLGPMRWRVSPGPLWFKVGAAVILAVVAAYAALAGNDPRQALVAGAAAAGLGAFALRDLVAPVRLEADADGVTLVAGFGRRVRLPWSHIEAVRVDVRSRYGLRSEHLEIDAGETLYLFGANDLSAQPDEVARTLDALRSSATAS